MEEKKPRPVKKPDVHAPRFRRDQFVHDVVNPELYERWSKRSDIPIDYKEFVNVWDKIAEVLREQVATTTHGVRLPFFNGDVCTNYVTSLRRHIDSVASHEVGYFVPALDWHTNRRQGRITWSINHARRQHRWLILFAFEPCKKLKQLASKGFMQKPETYRLARTVSYIAHKQSQND